MSSVKIHVRLQRATVTNWSYTGDFVEVGIWSGIEIDIGVVCVCLPSIRILVVSYAPRCMGMGSSADESDHPSRPSAQGERQQRRLRKRSYVSFDVEGGGGGGSSGRSGKSTLTAVASTPGGSTFMEGKKSPWEQSEFRLATFKRHSTEMVDDVMVATKD